MNKTFDMTNRTIYGKQTCINGSVSVAGNVSGSHIITGSNNNKDFEYLKELMDIFDEYQIEKHIDLNLEDEKLIRKINNYISNKEK